MDPIVINITDLTQGITQTDLSMPLFVATDKTTPLALVSSLDALEGVTADDNLYKMVAKALAQKPQEIYVMGIEQDVKDASAIVSAIQAANIPYYYFACDLQSAAQIKTLADYHATKVGFYLADLEKTIAADAAVEAATTMNNESVALMAHKGIDDLTRAKQDSFAACALIGKMAPVLEGTAPFFYQSLNGVPDGGYSAADVSKLQTGNVNTVTTYMKRVETWTGKTTKGSYCHFKVLKDWLVVRLKEALAKVIHNDAGVFMDDNGLGKITDAMKEVLNVGKVNRGVIHDYTVYTPLRSEIPANDRANGIVNGYQIQCTFTGFVEKVVINIVAEV